MYWKGTEHLYTCSFWVDKNYNNSPKAIDSTHIIDRMDDGYCFMDDGCFFIGVVSWFIQGELKFCRQWSLNISYMYNTV